MLGLSLNTNPLSVERIVDKLAELSEQGTKAVCLTCEGVELLPLKNFAHDHSNEIATMAREKFPFFSGEDRGYFGLGQRGFFYVPESIIGDKRDIFPSPKKCVNSPLSNV